MTVTYWDYADVMDAKVDMTDPCPMETESLEGDRGKWASSYGAGRKGSDQGPEAYTFWRPFWKNVHNYKKN